MLFSKIRNGIRNIKNKIKTRREIRKIKRKRLKGYKERLKNCPLDEFNKLLAQIENDGFSSFSPREIEKIIVSVLLARKDLNEKHLKKIREIGERNGNKGVDYLIYEYENGII